MKRKSIEILLAKLIFQMSLKSKLVKMKRWKFSLTYHFGQNLLPVGPIKTRHPKESCIEGFIKHFYVIPLKPKQQRSSGNQYCLVH